MKMEKRQMRYNYSVRKEAIRYVVIHDTGNPDKGADADANFRYFNNGDRGSSADIFVDDHRIVRANDYRRYYSWHCGDGHGKYGITNSNSVGIEICINQDGDYNQAVSNAVWVTKQLMSELIIPAERVVRHYDASRKNCPASMAANNWRRWNAFKIKLTESEGLTMNQYAELKQMITDLTGKVERLTDQVDSLIHPMIWNYIDENLPGWAQPTVKKLVGKGYLQGDENGLHLDETLLRILVINDRAGVYDR